MSKLFSLCSKSRLCEWSWLTWCVCVSLVLLFLNIIKWEAFTSNTMSGKIYWLSPNIAFDSQWLRSSTKGGPIIIISITHTNILIFWFSTNPLVKKLEIPCQIQHLHARVLLKHAWKFSFYLCDFYLKIYIHVWLFQKDKAHSDPLAPLRLDLTLLFDFSWQEVEP